MIPVDNAFTQLEENNFSIKINKTNLFIVARLMIHIQIKPCSIAMGFLAHCQIYKTVLIE